MVGGSQHGLTIGLRQSGFAVDWLKDGHSADLALQSEHFDLLVLDLGLPKMTGMEVLQRARSRGNTLPVKKRKTSISPGSNTGAEGAIRKVRTI